MSLLSVRRWFAALLMVLLAYFILVPGQRAVPAALAGLSAATVVVYATLTRNSTRAAAWRLIAAALVALTVGYGAEIATGTVGRPEGHPIPAAVAYLLVYLLLAVGLLWLGRPQKPSHDATTVLDTMAISLAVGFAVWVSVVRPMLEGLHLGTAGQVAAIATWVGYVVVLSGALRLVLAWRWSAAQAYTVAGVISLLVTAFLYGSARVDRTPPDAVLIGVSFFVFCGLIGAGALSASMASVASVPFARYGLGPLRLGILTVALLVAPTTLLIEAAAGVVRTAIAVAVLSSAVGMLLLIRLALAVRDYRHRVTRGNSVLTATQASVVATTLDEVKAAVLGAFANILPPGAPHDVVLEDEPGRDADVTQSATLRVRADGTGELRIPIDAEEDDRRRFLLFVASPQRLTELSNTLTVLTGQAGLALARIDLTQRLRGEERERYFRTLVMTSSDVILISRAGRIDYSTPSAYGMFGRDVVGAAFDDIMERRHPPAEGSPQGWANTEADAEGRIRRPDGAEVLVHLRRRDLRDDPTVNGVVTTVRDVTREHEFQEALAYRASHDPLTGLSNAETFQHHLAASRARTSQPGVRAALYIDLDDFKLINDTYGHEVGDGILVTVARRIQSCLSDGDVAARIGGDEFAVLLDQVPDERVARDNARRIAQALARPATVAGVDIDGHASVGLSVARTSAEVDTLLARADTALYAAKTEGKGSWREYHEGMATPGRRTRLLRDQLEAGIRDESVALYYQPVVELATGLPAGFEAVVRLNHGAGQPVQPDDLVAIAEDSALTARLNDWVLRTVLTDLATINSSGVERPQHVGVTFSARHLAQPGFAETAYEHLSATNVDASLLVIGIRGSEAFAAEPDAWNLLARLRNDGVRVAVDDYGTGYASLSSLRQSALDIVKIDSSFLHDLAAQRSRLLLEAVVRVPAALGLEEIAKGVAAAQARDLLVSLGCRYGQGSLYGEPMPLPDAVRWLCAD